MYIQLDLLIIFVFKYKINNKDKQSACFTIYFTGGLSFKYHNAPI